MNCLSVSDHFVGRPAALLKKRLWHRCFPVNLAKFLRTTFLQNSSGQLLLLVLILIIIIIIIIIILLFGESAQRVNVLHSKFKCLLMPHLMLDWAKGSNLVNQVLRVSHGLKLSNRVFLWSQNKKSK